MPEKRRSKALYRVVTEDLESNGFERRESETLVEVAWMHSTACCEGIFRSQPGRHGSRPGRSSSSDRSPHTVSEQQNSTSLPTPPDPANAAAGSTPPAWTVDRAGRTMPSSSCLAAAAAGAGATRPDPVGPVAGRANGGSLPHHWAGGQCAVVSLVSDVSWAACCQSLVCWSLGAY